jgi:hypothetical protein
MSTSTLIDALIWSGALGFWTIVITLVVLSGLDRFHRDADR